LSICFSLDGDNLVLHSRCIYSSDYKHDMLHLEVYTYDKMKFLQYNSTLGKYEGYTDFGIKNANYLNNNTAVMQNLKADMEKFCKVNAGNYYNDVYTKTVTPKIEVKLLKKSDGSHPAILMCSAYSFYPPNIEVTWLRDGKVIKGGVTSTEEMPDGDWYYQIHSHLEYMPQSGEEITCVVQHASSSKPLTKHWDPSVTEPDRGKIAIGASGLVLGIILSAAGFIYYKKKSSGRILVPS
ncbi:H-2 class II histocompatibility antigen, I-E beta chain-like, partial [Trichomycterus rosablanca]|uniref:H-2 class II histocompatibility antigen, I-E beta chain-like n=1 Tax=Trichomycterus rosablanca TaxID=2290929 RepID=UPI002F355335